MTTFRHTSAKKAWANLQARAEHGEKFGFIACLGVMFKSGALTRAEVLEHLKLAHISRDDLRAFRKSCE